MSNPTTPFGWQMPTATDLVTDLPADFEVFGQAVATSMADLLGGTTGQVLKKNTDADMDFVWAADAAGMTNPMTTTGDTIYSSSGSTPARLGIGTTGQVMTVAGGVPTWAAAASSVPANAGATVATAQTTSSATYTDLATAGPAVTVTTGTKALVIVTSAMRDTGGTQNVGYMSYAVSGATTVAATDASAIAFVSTNISAGKVFRFSAASVVTLTAGSNTFTAKYRTENVTDYSNRAIFVMNLA